MEFRPDHCPCEEPKCAGSAGFQYQRRGHYTRACDGRRVQRFQCKACKRTFSTQTFRVDYGLKRVSLDVKIFLALISKVTLRQIAKTHHCTLRTVARRLDLFGKQGRGFHEWRMRMRGIATPWEGQFQLDELETFEHNRRLKPVTVPVLVHKPSYCILHAEVGTLPARKPLSKANLAKLARYEKLEGDVKRKSESREKMTRCFEVLARVCDPKAKVFVGTDEKHTYGVALKRLFGARLVHQKTHSSVPRSYKNPLFPINHTFAMLRDNLSRLVRRNWGASKKREKLESHLWIYVAWRNYVRPITNRNHTQTAAMVAGLCPRMLEVTDLLAVRMFDSKPAQRRAAESLGGKAP
ncbi:MAG: hypothetical protein IPJ19_14135 [Planctomycetes bacterium]|nr:hypothetical protein [Planctomycetota bacterium]